MTIWQHFVGGAYRNKGRFTREAKTSGISRRVPAQVARGFHFGDKLILLRYQGKGRVEAFGEMVISEIIFEGEVSQKVGQQLIEKGEASYSPGSLNIHRECGSYLICGSFQITAKEVDIPQLVQKAQELSDDTVFCMIGGKLTREYSTWLDPAPKFTRGFIKVGDESFEHKGENKMVEIANYRRA